MFWDAQVKKAQLRDIVALRAFLFPGEQDEKEEKMCATRLLRSGMIILSCLAFILGVAACQEEPTGPRAWIDTPRDGASVPVGAPVVVLSHAYAREGVAEVMLSVNGQAYRRSPPSAPGSFVKATHEWFPDREGDYILQITTYSQTGEASSPATARVRAIGRAAATPVAVTPVAAPTAPGAPDLEIVSVEAVVAGYKGAVPFCNTRVAYRNRGAVSVPRDFTIQFHFNGVPTLANTVAGGLPAGASAEITFVYQFEGSPYIGINLDSTNVIAETNETNNAFAEIRLCSGTPAPTAVIPTAPIVVTPPPTLVPTQPPTVPPPPPPAQVNFRADQTTITRGQCTTLRWDVENATAVYLDGNGVAGHGTQQVCPNSTTTYSLHVTAPAGNVDRTVTITVQQPPNTPTSTKPPDTQGPPAPSLVSPSGTLSCRSSVTLDWNPVSDPSGIKTYYVKLERQITQGNWQSAGGWTTSSTAQSVPVQCGGIYRWQARAEDNAGNQGPWSGFMNFSINLQ
jgi:hypothetical protein